MAQKKITDLTLRSSVTEELNFPSDDGVQSYRVTAAQMLAYLEAQMLPAGMIMPFAGGTIPSKWLECDGSAVSRATYAALYSAIGDTWGAGDGVTTFNLPDFRGRTLIGAGTGSGLTARTIGQVTGAESVQLSTSHLPSHTHGPGSLSGSATTSTGGSHSHSFSTIDNTDNTATKAAGGRDPGTGSSGSTNSNGSHNHSVTVGMSSGATGSTGSDSSHPNMQPSAVTKYMIRTG